MNRGAFLGGKWFLEVEAIRGCISMVEGWQYESVSFKIKENQIRISGRQWAIERERTWGETITSDEAIEGIWRSEVVYVLYHSRFRYDIQTVVILEFH
jgi:hypothetical protein